MIIKTSLHFMRFIFVILPLLLLCLKTKIATPLGHQPDANGVTSKCIDKERYALLEFKAGLEDPFSRLSTWRAEDDCCKWRGVSCNNQTGHVTKLDLHLKQLYGRLKGEINPSLLNLSHLNYLDLYGNSFQGTIPKFIGSLAKLKYLDLSRNDFNGTIPKFLGSLAKLRYLDISWNSFLGAIPPELGNLTNLHNLTLAGLRNTVENLDWLSHLSLLQHLDMQGISLAKANHWVDVILRLQKLSYLSLSRCNLSQVTYPYSSFVKPSSSIATLDLSNNNLNSSMYHWLFPLTSNKLFYLDLSNNMLDGIPKYVGNLSSLTYLDFNGNSVDKKFPDFLNNLSGSATTTLKELYLSRSQFTGSLPDEIEKFSFLETLYLHGNQLNGLSEKVWELPMLEVLYASSNSLRGVIHENFGKSKLRYINLSNNSLEGVLSEVHMSNLSNLEHLDLSLNFLTFELSSHWVPDFQLQYMDLSFCKLGPLFPKWIQTQKNLTDLNIANSKISDTIPLGFWDMWPSRLRYLNLSSNNITGKVPDLLSNFDHYAAIDLSSNNFYGPIPNVPSSLVTLNLSRNKFYGGISFLCQIVDGLLSFLDLSYNLLTGQLPDCLSHFKELIVLNLGHNNLSGTIPISVGSLIQLNVLNLYNNNFSGELPLLLKNCTRLNFLYLGANKFSGNVPIWVGENLSRLYVLSLRSNNFFGHIPSQLCQLANLQILDLSMNKLYGTIPTCLNNLTAMVQKGFSQEQTIHGYHQNYISVSPDGRELDQFGNYIDYATIGWQGNEREFRSINLGLLRSIDLSCNNLVGQIPDELTGLHELLALNLSRNALHGKIPWKIGMMKSLLALDLSKNNLSGVIPSSMSLMTLLGYLDLSDNNLTGRIPSSTQLQSFDTSSYARNAGLCGPPITQNCPEDEAQEVPHAIFEDAGAVEGMDESWRWFYTGVGTRFATGFWIACGALLLNRRGRHAFFRFHDRMKDWIYLRMELFCAKLRRAAAAPTRV